jgi:hypothetical protein
MQHFRAKGGHFRRFFKGDDINAFCRRRDARVGGVDTRTSVQISTRVAFSASPSRAAV